MEGQANNTEPAFLAAKDKCLARNNKSQDAEPLYDVEQRRAAAAARLRSPLRWRSS
jgi:hypothetical protein